MNDFDSAKMILFIFSFLVIFLLTFSSNLPKFVRLYFSVRPCYHTTQKKLHNVKKKICCFSKDYDRNI